MSDKTTGKPVDPEKRKRMEPYVAELRQNLANGMSHADAARIFQGHIQVVFGSLSDPCALCYENYCKCLGQPNPNPTQCQTTLDQCLANCA